MDKQVLISMLSHQLRYPLSTARLKLKKTIRDDRMSSDTLKDLSCVANQLNKVLDFIDKILLIQKIEDNAYEAGYEDINLASFLHDIIKNYDDEVRQKGLTLNVKVNSRNTIIRTDSFILENIISNILSNAVKYSEDGGRVAIELSCPENEVMFKVRDQGVGIPKDEMSRLFNKFYRASNVRESRSEGVGLGLYISRMFVSMLGGRLELESEVGTGTCVFVTLPKAIN